MANLWGYLFGLFLLAHGIATVAIYAAPAGPEAPFKAKRSWLLASLGVPEGPQARFGVVIAGIAAITLAAGALGILGVPLLVAVWPWAVVVGASLSLILLGLYFHPWLSAGVGINAMLLVAILAFQWPANSTLGI